MREIKFRAWNKLEKKWTTADAILNPICSGDMINFNLHSNCVFSIRQDGIELTQYTGLKDKNGKEIYEGDIVRSKSIMSPHEFVEFPIEYKEGAFNIGNKLHTRLRTLEVIGNIYENPELLKEK